ncbi:ABC transporter permease [Novosphingobium sp.]|uniref:ABC transporter permease n=1 Tax=Novosphingobium sp. TaxID=1874826 RepID=UPI0035B20D84
MIEARQPEPLQPPSLRRSWEIQRRVIGALVMREVLTRYGRHNIGVLWLFVEPMMFTLGVATLWAVAGLNHSSNLPIVAFALTGYSAVLLWRNMPSRCIGSVLTNAALMYHRNVRLIDIYLSRLVLEAIGATTSFIVLSILFINLDMMKPPEDILKVAWGWGMLTWFGASFAMFLGALSERTELVEKIWHPVSYLMLPLSGTTFLVDAMPPQFQHMVMWIPMLHGTELMREGYFGSAIKAHYDQVYMTGVCLFFTLFALSEERYASKRVILE